MRDRSISSRPLNEAPDTANLMAPLMRHRSAELQQVVAALADGQNAITNRMTDRETDLDEARVVAELMLGFAWRDLR
jgi:hypothetical protein